MTLNHPLLAELHHGFGLRDTPEPPGLLRPRQVHGAAVVDAAACRRAPPPEADAVVSAEPGVPVGVVTADCVPVLLAVASGRAVAAVHAGWRGLAAGVVEAGVDALRQSAADSAPRAVLGPHIGACCYEVDAPVVDALSARYGPAVASALREGRPGHAWLDLGALVRHALAGAGIPRASIGGFADACTQCAAERFHSYRRDGARAGRLVHYVAAAQA